MLPTTTEGGASPVASQGTADAAKYGISEALLNDPVYGNEIKTVYDLFKAGNEAGALEALYKSSYYTTLSSTVRSRRKEQLEQPEVYKDNLEKYSLATRRRLTQAGIKIDEAALAEVINNAYATGMSDAQVDSAIITSGKVTGFGGNVLGDTSALKSYANSFGVSNLMPDSYWRQKEQELFSGAITTEDIQADIRAKSASAFPGYADQINNGVSVDALASAYKGAMATILERDADSIDYTDPHLRAALQYAGPDGKPIVKPLWQFEKELRSTVEWAYTNNARNTFDTLSLKVMKDWGLA